MFFLPFFTYCVYTTYKPTPNNEALNKNVHNGLNVIESNNLLLHYIKTTVEVVFNNQDHFYTILQRSEGGYNYEQKKVKDEYRDCIVFPILQFIAGENINLTYEILDALSKQQRRILLQTCYFLCNEESQNSLKKEYSYICSVTTCGLADDFVLDKNKCLQVFGDNLDVMKNLCDFYNTGFAKLCINIAKYSEKTMYN